VGFMPNPCDYRLVGTKIADILKTILDEKIGQFEYDFHIVFDGMKHDESNPDLIRVVKNSDYKSPSMPGKRWSDIHPLNRLA
jgi:hypothetical protein